MKASRIRLLLLSGALIALACMITMRPSAGMPPSPSPAGVKSTPPTDTTMSADLLPKHETPRLAETPVADTSRSPVQSLEERDDAMLFESYALFGTPFSQAAVMPFD